MRAVSDFNEDIQLEWNKIVLIKVNPKVFCKHLKWVMIIKFEVISGVKGD